MNKLLKFFIVSLLATMFFSNIAFADRDRPVLKPSSSVSNYSIQKIYDTFEE